MCPRCKQRKPAEQFRRYSRNGTGHFMRKCRTCANRLSRAKRKGRKKGSTLTKAQWEWIFEFWQGWCAYCGKRAGITKECVQPLSKGGKYTVANVVPACAFCNSSRSSQDLIGWLTRKGYDVDRFMNVHAAQQTAAREHWPDVGT